MFKLNNPVARAAAIRAINDAPMGWVVRITEETRTLQQNALLHPLLRDISAQVVWYGQKLSADDWKDVFTAALKKAKVVPGLNGGFVVCGLSSRKMGKAEFSELLDLIEAFGAEHGVKFNGSDHE
jgi:hypothetical protein